MPCRSSWQPLVLRRCSKQAGPEELLQEVIGNGYDSLEVFWEAFEDPNNLLTYARTLLLAQFSKQLGVTEDNFAFSPPSAKLKALRKAEKKRVEPPEAFKTFAHIVIT